MEEKETDKNSYQHIANFIRKYYPVEAVLTWFNLSRLRVDKEGEVFNEQGTNVGFLDLNSIQAKEDQISFSFKPYTPIKHIETTIDIKE